MMASTGLSHAGTVCRVDVYGIAQQVTGNVSFEVFA